MHKTLAEPVEALVLCIGEAEINLHFDKLSDRNFSFVQLLHNVRSKFNSQKLTALFVFSELLIFKLIL